MKKSILLTISMVICQFHVFASYPEFATNSMDYFPQKKQTVPIRTTNKSQTLSYETFIDLYGAMSKLVLPPQEMIKRYGLEAHQWKNPNHYIKRKIVGKNVFLDNSGNIKSKGEHAWCILIEEDESAEDMYLWMKDVKDIQQFIFSAEKYGFLQAWEESEYDDGTPAKLKSFVAKNVPKGKKTLVKYEDLKKYKTIGSFDYNKKSDPNIIWMRALYYGND